MSVSSEFFEPPTFDGANGVTCESFIQSIRRIALAKEIQRDDQRMAEEAAACLSGPVLYWFEELDEDTQESWKLLRRALLARWGEAGSSSKPPIAASSPPTSAAQAPARPPTIPTAAAAPPALPSAPLPPPKPASRLGRLRFVGEDGSILGYLGNSLSPEGSCTRTENVRNAAIVELGHSTWRSYLILWDPTAPRSGNVRFLGITFRDDAGEANLKKGQPSYAAFCFVMPGRGDESSSTTHKGPSYSNIWTVTASNEVIPMLDIQPSGWLCPLQVIIGTLTGSLSVTNNFEGVLRNWPAWKGGKARVIFEHL